jgi:glycosyltransferase involved in cell wall biosynthesis
VRSRGAGFARNRAVDLSTGTYLCFLDADDMMAPSRVQEQLAHLRMVGDSDDMLVGCRFHRLPADATPRYTAWCTGMTDAQLMHQRYRECTLIQPTWFCRRTLLARCGGYDETGVGMPEDLILFFRHLELGGRLTRAPGDLVTYRSVANALSSLVSKEVIWALRMEAVQRTLLDALPAFGIWSAGRDGKKFYRSLSPANRAKVTTFYEVDEKKIKGGIYWDESARRKVPIVHFSRAAAPFVLCVKLDLHEGFEANVASLGLVEGTDYWHFC